MKRKMHICIAILLTIIIGYAGTSRATPLWQLDIANPNPSPPTAPVKLIFIHHSTGQNWLADDNGGLGIALRDNNYFVSDTNYDWGPDAIGSNTDIGHWWTWFRGTNSSTYLNALYSESAQHAEYSRLANNPGGENEIIMFKSCFPNSNLTGSPTDAPTTGDNPMRGEPASDELYTVANAKGIYNDLLGYFATRQDKLFILITSPPLATGETDATRAANARALTNWLMEDWLDNYPHNNVAVFNFYTVLTDSNNHHRWNGSTIEHSTTSGDNFSYYPTEDSHPNTAGNQKATEEYLPLLNIYYNRWRSSSATTPTPTTEAPANTATPTTEAPAATVTPTTEAPANTPTPTATSASGTPGQQTTTVQASNDAIIASDETYADVNLGGGENLEVFFYDGNENRRSLIRVDMPDIPSNATIDSATLELYEYNEDPNEADMTIALYRVTRAWTEGTGYDFNPGDGYTPDGVTWNQASAGDPWQTPGGDYDTTALDETTLATTLSNEWVQLDATEAVRYWLANPNQNYGLLLRALNGAGYHYFYSNEATGENEQYRPRLIVRYSTAVETTPTPTATSQSGTPDDRALRVFLPLIARSRSTATANPTATPTVKADDAPTPTATSQTDIPAQLVQPADFTYLGAFRLPDDGERPRTFAYGGDAITFRPDGDASGGDNGFPGSLFITGHARMDEMTDGDQIAEVSIPEPVISTSIDDLNYSSFLQGFHNIAEGFFADYVEIPRVGMQYLDHTATGPKIHLCWGQHISPDNPGPTHAWFGPDLENPNVQGIWYVSNEASYNTNGYMLEIPTSWADEHVQGRSVGTGRFRDGGWSGMGPALFAYRPWMDESGTPATSGARLEATTLLRYASSQETDTIEQALNNYQHPDEWEGVAWLTTSTGKSAIVFAGTKGTGDKYWYGYINPQGPDMPCTSENAPTPGCRMADGSVCPNEDMVECANHTSERGWWSARFDAYLILYDPDDLAQVAAGTIESWEPQPYASLDIDEHLFLNPTGIDPEQLGTGVQRRFRIGEVTYDRSNDLLYMLELFADEAKPVVHVWRVQ